MRNEPRDKLVIRPGALLHDIADSKFHQGDETPGPEKAKAFLTALGLPQDIIDQVTTLVKDISFHSNLEKEMPKTAELKIVQDADRLDALGAIGIARAGHYGGYKNRVPIYPRYYHPLQNPIKNMKVLPSIISTKNFYC